MKYRIHSRYAGMLIAASLAASLGASPAVAQDDSGGASASEQWTKSLDQLEGYGPEDRAQAVEAGQSAADAADDRLQQMENWIAENWNDLSAEARADRREIVNDLRQQRNDLAEWFGAMKHSSAESWEEMKAGFVNAYNKLGEKFEATMEQFRSDDSSQ